MFLSTIAANMPTAAEIPALMKAVKDGLGIAESSIVFSFSPFNSSQFSEGTAITTTELGKEFRPEGDVFVVKAACLDMALWKIGGAAVALRLVQMANVRMSRLSRVRMCIHLSPCFRHHTRSRGHWVCWWMA